MVVPAKEVSEVNLPIANGHPITHKIIGCSRFVVVVSVYEVCPRLTALLLDAAGMILHYQSIWSRVKLHPESWSRHRIQGGSLSDEAESRHCGIWKTNRRPKEKSWKIGWPVR